MNADCEVISPFLKRLQDEGFSGDIGSDEAERLVASVDNSLYQVIPSAVVYPRTADDLHRLVRLAAQASPVPVPLTARGGGTGTNGQSLTAGVVVDTSRHLNRILAFDRDALTVTVEPGVVLGQLNAFLGKHGLFFPPMVSTASRATLGGMVATDASGKGSRLYGRTSDWVEALDVVLSDGSGFRVEPLSAERTDEVIRAGGVAGRAVEQVRCTVTAHAEEIDRVFPRMNRGLTGYNLQGATRPDGSFSLLRVLAGSEGTLALTTAIHLRVARIPSLRRLAVIRYDSFDATLSDVGRLLEANPLAIEVLDDKVVDLASRDVMWSGIERILGATTARPVKGISFVEFVGDDAPSIEAQLDQLRTILERGAVDGVLDWTLVSDPVVIRRLWDLREKSVGLMGKLAGYRQGAAFVEDCAVAPQHLPAFVREFRAILDREGLSYGMYGHADVGCLHVRPALDMRKPDDAARIRPVSDQVAALAKRHGGLLWGEHGRGFRGEYSPAFFGDTLYAELRAIKAAFDPLGILNPGKLASPPGGPALDRIDTVPTRGERDRDLDDDHVDGFGKAVTCNGNGACVSWDANEVMCPSYKASRDRSQSPTGRATLLREWARLDSLQTRSIQDGAFRAFEDQVHRSLSTCLACKACAMQCPVQVNIPAMRSRFLERYHRTRRRRLRDWLVASIESILPLATQLPKLANCLGRARSVIYLLKTIGLVDLPHVSIRPLPIDKIDVGALAALPITEKLRTVVVVADTFTASFDTAVPLATRDVLMRLGYRVLVAPARPNGKALHGLGFLRRFAKVSERARARHAALLATGVHVVGVEAVTVLMDRSEYCDDRAEAGLAVRTLDEFLSDEIAAGRIRNRPLRSGMERVRLLLHCTERSMMPEAPARWARVLGNFGLNAEVARTGCCGMAGLFGHEREHVSMSAKLFELTWRDQFNNSPIPVTVTGFSCRCQSERYTGRRPPHPVEFLLDKI